MARQHVSEFSIPPPPVEAKGGIATPTPPALRIGGELSIGGRLANHQGDSTRQGAALSYIPLLSVHGLSVHGRHGGLSVCPWLVSMGNAMATAAVCVLSMSIAMLHCAGTDGGRIWGWVGGANSLRIAAHNDPPLANPAQIFWGHPS